MEIAKYYKVFKTTESVDIDIKLLKKLNTLITKLKKTNKDIHKLEIFNIFSINENIFNVDNSFVELIKREYIKEDNRGLYKNLIIEFYENI